MPNSLQEGRKEWAGTRCRARGFVWLELPVDILDSLASLKVRSSWCWLKLKTPTSPACWASDSRAPEQIVFPFHADPVNSLAQRGSPTGTGLVMEAQVSSWHLAVRAIPSIPAPPSPSRRGTEKQAHPTSRCLHMKMGWRACRLERGQKKSYEGSTCAGCFLPKWFHLIHMTVPWGRYYNFK